MIVNFISRDLKEPANIEWSKDYTGGIFEEISSYNSQLFKLYGRNAGRWWQQNSQPTEGGCDFNNDGFDDFLITYRETRRRSSIVFSDGEA